MSRARRSAFTLVELLVVIVIIGMLMAMLLPAVQYARRNARRTQCQRNMGEVAKAIVTYETSKKGFPGYRNYSLASSTKRTVGWPVMILAQMDRGDLWEQWRTATSSGSPPSPTIALLRCPDDQTLESAGEAGMSFAINAGIPEKGDQGVGASDQVDESKNYGISHNRTATTPIVVKLDDIRDGASQTVLISENLQATAWSTDNPTEAQVGIVWWPMNAAFKAALSGQPITINAGKDDTAVDIVHARPSSDHGGIVNVGYCDGRVDAVDERIDYDVYQRMLTPSDARVDSTYFGNP